MPSERCREYHRDLAFAIKASGDTITVGFNKSDLGSHGEGDMTLRLTVPRLAGIALNMPAGRVDVKEIAVGSLVVDVTVGDITISTPKREVSTIDLDANFGDASVRSSGRNEHAPRSKLVGAEMHRQISDIGATIRAEVQFGNIQVSLTD
jgi:hypothetical protein